MLAALGSISTKQAKGIKKIYANTLWLLNHATTLPKATIWYTASDMILRIHSDASYLSELRACSRAGGHYFLGDILPDMSKPPTTQLHINGQEAVPIRNFLL